MHNPKLTVLGAGPGDPELITLKGVKVLQVANVVLYDALVNRELLVHAPNATHIFVGKRKGFHKYTQDEINTLIVENATNYGHVVRLKGGDPFIFGRGAEEIQYAKQHGLETAIVSGITSAIAVPAHVGIPLTKRGISESFWVITGTTSERKLSLDVTLAAQSTATVVILMGMSKLSEIVTLFKLEGKHKTPVGIIQNGTTTHEKSVFGTVDSIIEKVKANNIATPAIIVIGEVVNEASAQLNEYQNINKSPLPLREVI
ncbi:Uroporphyrinogen-III C-methyltransferase [Kordia antarctica]|uniref:uroporphyrinogen-III C-methyltransferase n=1 Tax=Kordia antarctica TaxID=1218801 RepID=A0A7L4ZP04_9FLAO|nr:uroporphyrinogen-III C-methyltransferase [Kordia antarctica]QHI38345.1 Uroporphyrinogen-III C-methyltransferase [Kordia antarctica]